MQTADESVPALAVLDSNGLNQRFRDCLCLTLAEREGAALATADARLASLAKSRGIEVWKVPAA